RRSRRRAAPPRPRRRRAGRSTAEPRASGWSYARGEERADDDEREDDDGDPVPGDRLGGVDAVRRQPEGELREQPGGEEDAEEDVRVVGSEEHVVDRAVGVRGDFERVQLVAE